MTSGQHNAPIAVSLERSDWIALAIFLSPLLVALLVEAF